MQILELKSVQRDDDGLYYRKTYTGAFAVIELITETVEVPIKFSVEVSPFGGKTVDLEIDAAKINYPLIPLMTKLKKFILQEEAEGKLP